MCTCFAIVERVDDNAARERQFALVRRANLHHNTVSGGTSPMRKKCKEKGAQIAQISGKRWEWKALSSLAWP